MRSRAFWTCVVVAMLGMGLLVLLSEGEAQIKMPKDFAFEQGSESPGPVTFSHEQHKEKVTKCTGCHVKVFKMKRGKTGPLTKEQMKAGKQCGACHDGQTEVGGTVVFAVTDEASCGKCHAKQ